MGGGRAAGAASGPTASHVPDWHWLGTGRASTPSQNMVLMLFDGVLCISLTHTHDNNTSISPEKITL